MIVRLQIAWRGVVRVALPVGLLLAAFARGAAAQSRHYFEWVPAGGIHFMGPLRASVSGGMLGIFDHGRGEEALLAQLEAGMGGAKVRGGIASTQAFLTGFTVEGSLLRTFGNPVGADRWRTYAGGEIHGIFVLVNVGVGLYAPLGGGGNTLKTITIGLGL